MRLIAALGICAVALPAWAQQQPPLPPPSIQVVGVATVSTKPDRATLVYWVTGEGKTADEASANLASKQKTIVDGLLGLLGPDTQLSSGEVSVMEVRSPKCDGPGNYNNRPRLSDGDCALLGFLATLQGTGQTPAVEKAGTAAGLAARLGARDARVSGFVLSNPAEAQRRATAAAIVNARSQAEAMAASAGVRLGPLLSLSDQNGRNELLVTGAFARAGVPPAPPAPPAPVAIPVSPRPLETQARVYAQFAIGR